MFTADPKTLARLAQQLERVMVFDPAPPSAKLAGELLKEMGARHVTYAHNTSQGLQLIAGVDPQLVCVEFSGAHFDGVELTALLRRSAIAARQAPVIMITSTATLESIRRARDAGAHEFLRKPYTARDLFRRVENVILNPRPWIEARNYVGPDRRRFNSAEFSGAKRRRLDRVTERDAGPVAAAAG